MADANEAVHTNVKFKDRLFCIVFGAEENKKHLISLYNAINGTDFGESETLEITTLDDAIYIRMKNDILFIIASDLSLYEQQSTFNPNMPLRGFLYQGHNKELMEKCAPLGEYSNFIALVRKHQESFSFDEAVDRAVTEAQAWPCIGPYLFKNRNEVRDVLLTEFDAELHDKATFEAGRAEGEASGLAKGRAEGETAGEVKSLARLVVNGLIPLNVAVSQLNLSEEDFIQQALMLNISIKR